MSKTRLMTLLFRAVAVVMLMLCVQPVHPQSAVRSKLSPWLRRVVKSEAQPSDAHRMPSDGGTPSRELTAFARLADDGSSLLEHGARSLARFGNIHIVAVPLGRLGELAADGRVMYMESRPSPSLLLDSMAIHLSATPVYAAEPPLTHAYDGTGVVMGLMDIGFDLTHPSFCDSLLRTSRISRFWDMLSADTVGSPLYVGRDYRTAADIQACGHSRDGLDFTHGTYTLGIAAGNGAGTPYRGMAPAADICIVANAVSDDIQYIDSADYYKYTFATDALGFKYIFDYAESVGKPCVISFSEGSPQDLYGYDQLYYEVLDSLTGPGRIVVAAAGNEGHKPSHVHKRRGEPSAGTFLLSGSHEMTFTMTSHDDFQVRLVDYGDEPDTLILRPADAFAAPDSSMTIVAPFFTVDVEAYPSAFDSQLMCYDLTVHTARSVGNSRHLSVEMLGQDADVELWRVEGYFTTYAENPSLQADSDHNVHSPSSAPSVISVGSTSWRDYVVNSLGERQGYWPGRNGMIADFSSKGPTMLGLVKPDCVAPGNNIISSNSSFFTEAHPDQETAQEVMRIEHQGRQYPFVSSAGTSASAPAVGGAVALWMQARPSLSPSEAKALIARHSRQPDPSLAYPNNVYGYGEIDVYGGMLDLLGLSSVDGVPTVATRADVSVIGSMLTVTLPQAATHPEPLRLFDLGGRTVLSVTMPAGQASFSVSLSALKPAVYAVSIAGGSALIRVPAL